MTSPLRDSIRAAYNDLDCPHYEIPCPDCVADAVAHAIGAPVEGQRQRVDALEARLIASEVARIEAVKVGDRGRHNDLANMNRLDIGQVAVNDLRSLVTRWMLRLGKAAYEAKPPQDPADLPPGSVLGWGHNVLMKDADGVWSWAGFDKRSTDGEVQAAMSAATVLRVGFPR